MVCLAKSKFYLNKPVTVIDHCMRVANMAKMFAGPLDLDGTVWRDAAFLVGLVHDFGKYGISFQDVLAGIRTGVDHAVPGAAILTAAGAGDSMLETCAGHHKGLLRRSLLDPYIKRVMDGGGSDGPYGMELSIHDRGQFSVAAGLFAADWRSVSGQAMLPKPGRIPEPPSIWPAWKRQAFRMLMSRMLLSCQVDADYTVSAVEGGDMSLGSVKLDPMTSLTTLDRLRADASESSTATGPICELRGRTYSACEEAGRDMNRGFWTLSAPTGSGKTFGMLKFALERAAVDSRIRRIVFVLPFLSLTDQMAAVASEIIPGTIVDTSTVDNRSRDERIMSDTWDAPCVVTTAVQFFGSLFSDMPGDVRKLHNLADSVVVLDEIQALPYHVCRQAAQVLSWLHSMFGTVILASTATQPAFWRLPDTDWQTCEAVVDVVGLYVLAGRKRIEFREGRPDISEIADEAVSHGNVAVVCNLRRHAKAIFDRWKASGVDGIYMISSDLCSDHRKDIIGQIKCRQLDGLPVHVAATQCIEAGVDLDFEWLYRSLAPLTSVLQAAGRQDRNGVHPHGATVVFEPASDGKRLYPDGLYEKQAMAVKEMLAAGWDVSSPDAVQEYYRRTFSGFAEPEKLLRSLEGKDYPVFASETRLIRNGGVTVVVPYGLAWNVLIDAVREGCVTKAMLAAAGGSSVSCFDHKLVEAVCEEVVVGRDGRRTGVYILPEAYKDMYDGATGLSLSGGEAVII